MTYASFWKRVAASLLDTIFCSIIYLVFLLILGVIVGTSMGNLLDPNSQTSLVLNLVSKLLSIALFLGYYVWPESSSWQATLGKRIFGLKVTDINGQRVSFLRSLGRNAAEWISGLILGIGYLMCLWTEKRQCLHDQLADCLVIDTNPQAKQGCVIGCVIGFFVLIFVVFIGGIMVAIALPQYAKAMERAQGTQAKITLHTAVENQRAYANQHRHLTSSWKELNVGLQCQNPDEKMVCKTQEFTFQMEKDGISATRNGNDSYRLFQPYQDKPMTCTSNGHQCQMLGF